MLSRLGREMPMKNKNNKVGLAFFSKQHSHVLVYLKYIFLTDLALVPVVFAQVTHFYQGVVEPHFFVLPLLVGTAFGILMGRSALLRQQMQEQGEQFRAIADLAQEFTYFRRLDGRYEYVSPASLTMTGYAPSDFYNTPSLMDILIHPEDRARWSHHVHSINDGGQPESFELRLLNRDNRVVWFQHICAPVYDEKGKQVGVRSTNLDITQRKEGEEHIQRMAFYDPLTEMPNRHSLVNRIQTLIDTKGRSRQRFAVLFLDLCRFKNINDSFGHAFGDRLLKAIATRLGSTCNSECMVSRFGGDEFVILLERVSSKAAAAEMAKRLLLLLEQPLELEGIDLHISASVGIALYPEDGTDGDTLIRNADVAMYKSKKESSGNIRIYSVDDSNEAAHFVTTERNIQRGIQNREFIAFFQPKVDLLSGRVIGLEALARWQHPEQGVIPPGQFIAIAEETGQINALASQILEQVLKDIHRWQELGIAVPVAINVSARQFADHDYCQSLIKTIHESGCTLSLLEVEVTEQVFLGDIESAASRLRYLRSAGLTVALDDFGTGYSSFNYIKQLPINTLKVDRSFIAHIDSDKAEFAIIKALASLCQDLRLNMVVEGVETDVQRQALVSLGCDKAQGYHFFRPMPAGEVEELLQQQRASFA